MQNYKMKIAYDGKRYMGFNTVKGNADKSVQGKLEAILKKLYKEDIEVIGAVDTDAGVHAKGQVVNFTAPNKEHGPKELLAYFEEYLPDDIIAFSVKTADERFQSRYHAQSMTYQYRLWKKDAPNRPLFERHYVNTMVQLVDVAKMKEAAEEMVGEHDYLAFTSNKKAKKSVRKVYSVDVEETKHEIIITMTAKGFLRNMERYMVGTLIQVGLGQLPKSNIQKAFESKSQSDVGHKASSGALTLTTVQY